MTEQEGETYGQACARVDRDLAAARARAVLEFHLSLRRRGPGVYLALTGALIAITGFIAVIEGPRGRRRRWSAEWNLFAKARLLARLTAAERRLFLFCEECGFRKPGHSPDCRQVFKPARKRCVFRPSGYDREEAGIERRD